MKTDDRHRPAEDTTTGSYMGRPPVLDDDLMYRLCRKKLSNKEILAYLDKHNMRAYYLDGEILNGEYLIGSGAISSWKRRHGFAVRSRSDHRKELIPWRIPSEQTRHRYYYCLALEARDRENRTEGSRTFGEELSYKDRSRLDKFKRELAESDAVVYFDREIGWVPVRPRPGIDTDLIFDPRVRDDGKPDLNFDPKA